MSLPTETAEQTRRMLLEICQDHIRKVVDSLREVCMMIAAYQDGNDVVVMQHYQNVVKYDEESTEIKRALMKELADIGMILLSREDFLRLSSEIATVADYCAGISFRLGELTKRKWKVGNEVMKDISHLAEASLDCLIRLRETVLSVSYGGSRTLELAKNVESAEKTVDAIYRKVDLRIMTSDMRLPVILMLRDVARFLEGVADVAENANDLAKFLAITI